MILRGGAVVARWGMILRGGAVVARWAHNPKVARSSRVPATNEKE